MGYRNFKKLIAVFSVLALMLSWLGQPARAGLAEQLELIKLPPGFTISLYARVPGARSIAVVPEIGAVFVGSRGDTIHVIRDEGLKGRPQGVSVFASGLKVANGIAVRGDRLYVAEQHRIISLPLSGSGEKKILLDKLPDFGWHGWRYAAFSPEGKLFVSIGAPCNICRVRGLQGTIIEVDPDTGANRIFARGIRNSVGLDFHPSSGELYFTDNGADNMGDDVPPDELNHAAQAGLHFGFPWYGGGSAKTREFGGPGAGEKITFPIVEFGAHTASLGVHFYRGGQFPAAYKTSAFVAQHGSWNRSTPVGYRIMHLKFDEAVGFLSKEVFADGWLQGSQKWGRPVDVAQLPDGSLLVSDDMAGAIYRITYQP